MDFSIILSTHIPATSHSIHLLPSAFVLLLPFYYGISQTSYVTKCSNFGSISSVSVSIHGFNRKLLHSLFFLFDHHHHYARVSVDREITKWKKIEDEIKSLREECRKIAANHDDPHLRRWQTKTIFIYTSILVFAAYFSLSLILSLLMNKNILPHSLRGRSHKTLSITIYLPERNAKKTKKSIPANNPFKFRPSVARRTVFFSLFSFYPCSVDRSLINLGNDFNVSLKLWAASAN